MNKTILAAVIAVVALGGIAWYASTAPKSAPQDSSYETGTENSEHAGMMEDGTEKHDVGAAIDVNAGVSASVGTEKTFTVSGSNFAFAPSSITVNKGDKVKIIFNNSGGFHDLKIDEFNVATAKINGGASETVEFVADKAGSFEYYCSVGTHRAMGMKGTLIVK